MSRWIDFENYPSTATPLSASVLNTLQDDIKTSITDMWKVIYPVGSIYISTNSNSPETLFGGRWEQLKDRFLLGAGDTYTAGSTGGASNHRHPMSHTHTLSKNGWAQIVMHGTGYICYNEQSVPTWKNNFAIKGTRQASGHEDENYGAILAGATDASSISQTDYVDNTGSTLPPYLTVYMWKRLPDNA